ncbi:MAG: MFS transporter [Kiloniellales bacterium]
MRATVAPLAALFVAISVLLMGNGLQGTLLPLRAHIEAFSTFEIGVLGSSYFIGFGAGCLLGGHVIRRVGHIRAFAGLVSLASAMALAHALLLDPIAWWLIRGLTGFCFAAITMIIESWLNERSTNQTRGTILSIYTIINLTVVTLGQLMITLYDPAAFPLFAIASILVSLAAVPVALTTSRAPAPIAMVQVRVARLYRMSPVGTIGCLAVGLSNGAFWALGPIFAQQSGLDIPGVAFFMSVTVIAGALGQWPLGFTSDRVDRRAVIAGACLAASLAGIGMVLFNDYWDRGILIFAFAFGAFAFPLYSLCVAHTNDFVPPTDYVEAASGLLLAYALGAVAGPVIASPLMSQLGADGLFVHTATVHALLAGFAMLRMRRRERAPADERVGFTEAMVASQTVSHVDTRVEQETVAGATNEQPEAKDAAEDPAATSGEKLPRKKTPAADKPDTALPQRD